MTNAAKQVLDEFDALSEAERAQILDELVLRAALSGHGLPTDADLTATADHLFAELDRREQPL